MCNDVDRLQQGKRPLEEQDFLQNKKKIKQEMDVPSQQPTLAPDALQPSARSFFNYKGFAPIHHNSKPIDLDPKPKKVLKNIPIPQEIPNDNEVIMAKKSTVYRRRGCGKIFNSAEQDMKTYVKAEITQFFKPCALCKP